MVYVSPDTKEFYLSKRVMKELEILPKNFPSIGPNEGAGVSGVDSESEPKPTESKPTEVPICDCPRRTLPPGLPG